MSCIVLGRKVSAALDLDLDVSRIDPRFLPTAFPDVHTVLPVTVSLPDISTDFVSNVSFLVENITTPSGCSVILGRDWKTSFHNFINCHSHTLPSVSHNLPLISLAQPPSKRTRRHINPHEAPSPMVRQVPHNLILLQDRSVSVSFDPNLRQSVVDQTIFSDLASDHPFSLRVPWRHGWFATSISMSRHDLSASGVAVVLGQDWRSQFDDFLETQGYQPVLYPDPFLYCSAARLSERHASSESGSYSGSEATSPRPGQSYCSSGAYSVGASYRTMSPFRILFSAFSDASSHLFVMSESLGSIHEHMHVHGLAFTGLGLLECWQQLMFHLASGSCRIPCSDGAIPVACAVLCEDFVTPQEIGFACISAAARSYELTLSDLQIIVRSINRDVKAEDIMTCSVQELRDMLVQHLRATIRTYSQVHPHHDLLQNLDRLSLTTLQSAAVAHGLQPTNRCTKANLQKFLADHLLSGSCSDSLHPLLGCSAVLDDTSSYYGGDVILSSDDIQARLFESVVGSIRKVTLRLLLDSHSIQYEMNMSLHQLRAVLRKHIIVLRKGKRLLVPDHLRIRSAHGNQSAPLPQWPVTPDRALKDRVLALFRKETGRDALRQVTCASCAETCFARNTVEVQHSDVDLQAFLRPDLLNLPGHLSEDGHQFHGHEPWFDIEYPSPPMPELPEPFSNYLLHPQGFTSNEAGGEAKMILCDCCYSHVKHGRMPALAIINRNYIGPVPDELQCLTPIEEMMISLCRAKNYIFKIKDVHESNNNNGIGNPSAPVAAQRRFKGHVIVYPQRVSEIAKCLPPTESDILTPVCVIFVGAALPNPEWLKSVEPLVVRREKVRGALEWLKKNNPLYCDVVIDHTRLDNLADIHTFPFHFEHVATSASQDNELTARYDSLENARKSYVNDSSAAPDPLAFENVVVADVDPGAPIHALQAAAARHVRVRGGGYISVPHDPQPARDFNEPTLLPRIYPSLFPYGVGGCEDAARTMKIGFKRHLRHFLNLCDPRFQQHYSFIFTTFNMMQRREALLNTHLKVKKGSFDSVAAGFAAVSPDALQTVAERVANGDWTTARSDEEKRALRLMRQVRGVTRTVPGSSAARTQMRNEIRAMMMELGMPSFFITINPADTYSPILKFLAGNDIDIDNLLPHQIPKCRDQSILVAKNPVIAAKFFDTLMQSTITALLKGSSGDGSSEPAVGILGQVKGYYGCVEAQGRGSLHCHMLIWIEGALNPNEIRDKLKSGNPDFEHQLISYLEDAICTNIPSVEEHIEVPSDTYHPSSVRGMPLNDTVGRAKDVRNMARQVQCHDHGPTCFKYGTECRFDLHKKNYLPETSIDRESGELCLRCLDGLVNNFNLTMIEAIRCNMDIKFIGSGASAKAVLYYITDYITKTQLKTHIAFAALELAVRKLGEFDPHMDEIGHRAKRLLQRCAYAMISQQELSAQQVASYMLNINDHYTSHKFRTLYWLSFENFVAGDEPTAADGISNDPLDEVRTPSDAFVSENVHAGVAECQANIMTDCENEEEVLVQVNEHGRLVPKTGAVIDYIYRGAALEELCVWDFVSQLDKSKIVKSSKPSDPETLVDIDDVYDDDNHSDELQDANVNTYSKRAHRVRFMFDHPERESFEHRVRNPSDLYVPVPIGPPIPRRDREEQEERHARLMLIMFSSWRSPGDLRKDGQSWLEAYHEFLPKCPLPRSKIIDNMQLLHECRDSRDDHFAQRRAREVLSSVGQPWKVVDHADADPHELPREIADAAILEHMESIDFARMSTLNESTRQAMACLQSINECGMFSPETANNVRTDQTVDVLPTCHHFVPDVNDDADLEAIWRREYEQRRNTWRQQMCQIPEIPAATDVNNTSELSGNEENNRADVPVQVAHIAPPIFPREPGASQRTVQEWIEYKTLNAAQAMAFKLIAEHSTAVNAEPLRMYVGGPGGTGKSRVIDTVREFFEARHQSRRFRVAAFTGAAAKNISGMTLHSVMQMGKNTKRQKYKERSVRSNDNLRQMWEGVDYLFVDEISMVGCAMLHELSETMRAATGSQEIFGGLSVIFAGDFAQLQPVGQKSLYARNAASASRKTPASVSGQTAVGGRMLWLSINTVILLTEQMRQTGHENDEFVSILTRLREGKCTAADFATLSSRSVENVLVDWDASEWKAAPIIVSENAVKDLINEKAAECFAKRHGKELHWYYAVDSRGGKVTDDPALISHLRQLSTSKTNGRLGRIPLVEGMPVIITQNFDVPHGVVNGCRGTLKRVRYRLNAAGERIATSCVVEAQNTNCDGMSNIGELEVPIFPDDSDMTFQHPFTKRNCTMKRFQLPIVPGFCMTAHKAQGLTLPNVIVDLQSCRGTESPYVMVSRAKSLNGLLILRPFQISKIQCRRSEDARIEMRRLYLLSLDTTLAHGTAQQKLGARSILDSMTAADDALHNPVSRSNKRRAPVAPTPRRITKQKLT